MHIPDAVLSIPVCAATSLMSLSGLGWAASQAMRGESGLEPARFAGVTALIFAGQLLNVPLAFESSGHLFGGVLAAVLLGIPWGMLTMALVLVVQCLMFSDGGLAALGANVLNMSLIGAGLGGWLAQILRLRGLGDPVAAGLAATVSILAAAGVASVELALSGVASLAATMESLFLPHVPVAGLEGLMTAAVVGVVVRAREGVLWDKASGPLWAVGFPLVALMLGLLSPWASALPDAYERGLEILGVKVGEVATFVGVFPDYDLPGLGPVVAVVLAGWLGTMVAWIVASLVATGTTQS